MGGYIGAKTGTLVASASDIRGDISATDTTPEITLKNTTETDADGSRDGKITFKGEQSGGEESTLAQIQSSHDGTSDDQKGDLIFKTNGGSDGASPTEAMRIDSSQNVAIGNTVPTGKLTISESAGSNAPTSITADNTYLQLGSGDFGASNNGKFMIGFGFTDGTTNTNSPAYIGFQETSTSGDTKGVLTFHTRDVITDTAPSERLRIESDGVIHSKSGVLELNSESTASSGEIDKIKFRKAHTSGVGTGEYDQAELRSFTSNGFAGGLNVYTGKSTGGGNYASSLTAKFDEEGMVTIPNQPMFDAYLSTDSNHSAGTYNLSTGDAWSTRTNIGNHFSSGTFTAPVAGSYLFTANITANGSVTSMTYFGCEFQVNGQRRNVHWFGKGGTTTSYFAANNSTIINLAANDIVRLASEKAQATTVLGGTTYTSFTGMLLG